MITKSDVVRGIISEKIGSTAPDRITWLLRLTNRYQMRKWGHFVSFTVNSTKPATLGNFCRADHTTINYICEKYGDKKVHYISGDELHPITPEDIIGLRGMVVEHRCIQRLWDRMEGANP